MIARRVRDPYNKKGKRNESNTSQYDYNCGGYAFKTFSWLHPSKSYNTNNYGECHNSYQRAKVREVCIAHLLRTVPRIRVIKRNDPIAEDEYRVAFRLADFDFHFLREEKDGTWMHKAGSSEIKVFQGNPFGRRWMRADGEYYYGKVVLFAVKDR